MKYTKYFSILTKENGQPNLNTEQFRRMMNIVSVEGIIHGMNRIKEKYKGTLYQFNMLNQDDKLKSFSFFILYRN